MTTPQSADVRRWAREHGLVTADRGRLPREVFEAYTAAHSELASGPQARSRQPARRRGRPGAPARTEQPDLEARLREVETQLADAVARLAAQDRRLAQLERQTTRSLLGLRISL